MQVGVDAMTVMGSNHEWSYIRLNGNNYHIDPTFALSMTQGDLCYFLMSDEKRCEDGMFQKANFTYCSNYSQDHPHPDYDASDTSFGDLQYGYFDSLDHENQILYYRTFYDFSGMSVKAFEYKGF